MAETVTFQTPPTGSEAPPQNQPQQQEQQTPAASSERPEWLPANFNTVEDFVRSSTDTKAELTRVQQELAALKKSNTPEQKPDATKPTEPKTPEGRDLEITEEQADAVSQMDFSEYSTEFNTTGDVTVENREKIAEKLKGVFGEQARSIVDNYIEGSKQRVANTTAQLKQAAGGDAAYAEMISWARTNLSKDEAAAFNKQVNSGDFHAASFAISALRAKHLAAVGASPSLVDGDTPVASGNGFKSLYEMKQAIDDPRYAADPAYRKSVEQRVAISNL